MKVRVNVNAGFSCGGAGENVVVILGPLRTRLLSVLGLKIGVHRLDSDSNV